MSAARYQDGRLGRTKVIEKNWKIWSRVSEGAMDAVLWIPQRYFFFIWKKKKRKKNPRDG